MSILLITNCWTPYNTAGLFRWWNFAKYIDINILTTKKQRGILDETLENRGVKVKRVITFTKIAFFNGLYLSLRSIFYKSDLYVFTIPSETLLFGAYINQLLGRRVLLDVRDRMDRKTQPVKAFVPIYDWLYRHMKNVVVSWEGIDKTKTFVRHGHDGLKLKIKEKAVMPKGRYKHKDYLELLQRGYIPPIKETHHPKTQSGYINVKHLWGNITTKVDEEIYCRQFYSWEEQANKMLKILLEVKE